MKKIWYSLFIGVSLLLAPNVRAGMAVLELQRSTDMKTWNAVPVDETLLTTSGGILQNTNDPKAFYRIKINGEQNAGFTAAMLLSDAPPLAVDIAQQFLRDTLLEDAESDGGDQEGGWQDVELGPVCYPMYDPAVDLGKTLTYIEFKVIKKHIPIPDPPPDEPLPIDPPLNFDNRCDFGRILVSVTPGDFPVAEFSESGPTAVEMLLRKARGNGPIKPLRFDNGFLVAEDANGEVVGTLGNEPFFIDPQVLSLAGKEFEGLVDEQGNEQGGDSPTFPASPYKSYREMKTDIVQNPLYQELRNRRAELAKTEWDLMTGNEPPSLQVPVGKRQEVLAKQLVETATLDDPSLATLVLEPGKPGLWITGVQEGGTLLRVVYADGSKETLILLVTPAGAKGASLNLATSGWTSWHYWYAGNWGDQRRYNQFWHDSQMCSGGWSGCGPTAWTMLYGWWDRKGSPRLLKNTSWADAPLYNDNSVRDCARYVFSDVGPFCVNGQAATMPWNMKNGHYWAAHRGAGYYISWSWGVPYLSPGSRNRAIGSIKSGRPAIVGLGFYWHYPFAYGYAERKYKFLGITLNTSQYFKCNMGWGGSSPQWQNASSTWFGTNGHYW